MLLLKFAATFLLSTILILGAAIAVSIVFSHRIAGPIYRVETALERWKKGNVEGGVRLRAGDEFTSLADAYNEAAVEYTTLRNQVRSASKRLHTLSKELDHRHTAQMNEILGELECSIEKKN